MSTLRKLVLLGVLLGSVGGLGLSVARADDAQPPAAATPAPPAAAPPAPADTGQTAKPDAPEAARKPPSPTVDVADLLAAPPLPEIELGDAKAPVTIVEYHSMTCPHCAHFADDVLPTLEEKYIKTGKVRLILRSFPLNQLDAVAFMMLRCKPTLTYVTDLKYMYKNQNTWAFTKDPQTAVADLAKKLGFTQESFQACLHDQTIWDGLVAIAKKADTTFQVDGTPTFFINGDRHAPIGSVEDLDKVLAPYVKS